jgi:hypothetical protein
MDCNGEYDPNHDDDEHVGMWFNIEMGGESVLIFFINFKLLFVNFIDQQ